MLDILTAHVNTFYPRECFCDQAMFGEMVRVNVNKDNEPLSISTDCNPHQGHVVQGVLSPKELSKECMTRCRNRETPTLAQTSQHAAKKIKTTFLWRLNLVTTLLSVHSHSGRTTVGNTTFIRRNMVDTFRSECGRVTQ